MSDDRVITLSNGTKTIPIEIDPRFNDIKIDTVIPNRYNFQMPPNVPIRNLMIEQQKQTNELIVQLQDQLSYSAVQLSKAKTKIASQTKIIEQLKADLKEKSDNEEKEKNKISSKEIKLALVSGLLGLITGLVCAYFSFVLNS